ncbi:hypothetical protein [Agriterribacter sp.]|uniref:hypothetical protein n=1 Tax=Agriterribacter sp. TaxID=2821509 RepID=UPI002C0F1A42|nr:hypothetical protein [Agriterribacter sp.]HRP56035.1 hypothetical protein [Agriterribacter sp.]
MKREKRTLLSFAHFSPWTTGRHYLTWQRKFIELLKMEKIACPPYKKRNKMRKIGFRGLAGIERRVI